MIHKQKRMFHKPILQIYVVKTGSYFFTYVNIKSELLVPRLNSNLYKLEETRSFLEKTIKCPLHIDLIYTGSNSMTKHPILTRTA
jgi:hypothetical protein